MTLRRILIVTNGYAEDSGAAAVLRALPTSGVAACAYPLVGVGLQLAPETVLLDPRRDFPSGGFGMRGGWASLRADLQDGLLGFWIAQRRTLRAQRGRVDLAVALGDVYCLWMAAAAGVPTMFVAAPKSEYIGPHSAMEIWMMRRLACEVIARDERTAAALRRRGLPAIHVGFWMMDSLSFSGETFGLPRDRAVVTILAGSKPPAFENLPVLLHAVRAAAAHLPRPPAVLVAWAPHLSVGRLRDTVAAAGGTWTGDRRFRMDGLDAMVTIDHYGDALARATVVLGMAGGANEHAAGLGKPVVAFPGAGPQFTPRFLREQQRLIGEALVATSDWRSAASALGRLLRDPAERGRRGQAGLARLGGSGAAAAIAARVMERLRSARVPQPVGPAPRSASNTPS